MSMICFCQANVDLSEYGLRNAHAIGMTCANEIINVLNFSNHSWSNDIFGILWDNSINEMNPLLQNKSFLSTPIFSFLNSVTDYCEKIAIFIVCHRLIILIGVTLKVNMIFIKL